MVHVSIKIDLVTVQNICAKSSYYHTNTHTHHTNTPHTRRRLWSGVGGSCVTRERQPSKSVFQNVKVVRNIFFVKLIYVGG